MWHSRAAKMMMTTTTTMMAMTWLPPTVHGDNADSLSTRRDMVSDGSIAHDTH